ncbi:exosortase A [Paraglaciecola sp.]|uniref:exosortase A n=1 Tax=Paraglaciecola sp. TaxID=1920173 RepID=UPI00273D1093|nr:exosortase A [Paraglaciecola sp.]MDP5030514.1 exosortase A [Paraglaciecola sp.]
MNDVTRKRYHWFFLSLLILWFVIYFSILKNMVSVWQGSETYTYCFLILPIVLYLINEKKSILATIPLRTCFWFIVPLFLGQLAYLLADLAGVSVLTHLSAYGSLVCLVGLVYGWKIFKFLIFPLAFLVFAVPMGEELVPFLQQVTADISVFLVRLVGIPVYREGLYIYIPNGTFVVAEACSGIRFLISMISIAALYAYLFYVSFWRRTAFVIFSIILSIIANGIRAFGIIYIGHVSNMTHAVGFDHLVYGWFFFAFVLIFLLFFGKFWRDDNVKRDEKLPNLEPGSKSKYPTFLLLIVTFPVLSFTPFYHSFIVGKLESTYESSAYVEQIKKLADVENEPSFSPTFPDADVKFTAILNHNKKMLEVFVAEYQQDNQEQELVSSVNRLFDIDKFSLVKSENITLDILNKQVPVTVLSLVTVGGFNKTLIYWYDTGVVASSSAFAIKKAQLLDKLVGGKGSGIITIVNIDGENQKLEELRRLIETLEIFNK